MFLRRNEGVWRAVKYEARHSPTFDSHSFKDLYSQIDFDDLHDQETSPGIVLEMQERQRYFEGRMLNGASDLMQVCFRIISSIPFHIISPWIYPAPFVRLKRMLKTGKQISRRYVTVFKQHCILYTLFLSLSSNGSQGMPLYYL